jgi:hypothetical protein
MPAIIEEIVDEGDEQELWPVNNPPHLDDMQEEELSKLQTLEERIMHRYTPGKLDMNATANSASTRTVLAAHNDAEPSTASSVKACPTCSGVGKVCRFVGFVLVYSGNISAAV